MKYNLTLSNRNYSYYGSLFLCLGTLSEFFDLADDPINITIVVSKEPNNNSYFIKPKLRGGFYYGLVTLSNGEQEEFDLFISSGNVLGQFPNGCYVSVIA